MNENRAKSFSIHLNFDLLLSHRPTSDYQMMIIDSCINLVYNVSQQVLSLRKQKQKWKLFYFCSSISNNATQ